MSSPRKRSEDDVCDQWKSFRVRILLDGPFPMSDSTQGRLLLKTARRGKPETDKLNNKIEI